MQGNNQVTLVPDRDLPDEGAPTDALFVIAAKLVNPAMSDLLTINSQGGLRGPGGGESGNVRPRLNLTQPPPVACRADLNSDGELNPDDLADYINCYFEFPLPCPLSDFNRSGETDPDDLADYINAYFEGCI